MHFTNVCCPPKHGMKTCKSVFDWLLCIWISHNLTTYTPNLITSVLVAKFLKMKVDRASIKKCSNLYDWLTIFCLPIGHRTLSTVPKRRSGPSPVPIEWVWLVPNERIIHNLWEENIHVFLNSTQPWNRKKWIRTHLCFPPFPDASTSAKTNSKPSNTQVPKDHQSSHSHSVSQTTNGNASNSTSAISNGAANSNTLGRVRRRKFSVIRKLFKPWKWKQKPNNTNVTKCINSTVISTGMPLIKSKYLCCTCVFHNFICLIDNVHLCECLIWNNGYSNSKECWFYPNIAPQLARDIHKIAQT